jgi:hypothetical protein
MFGSPQAREGDAVTLVRLVFEHFCDRDSSDDVATISPRSLAALVLDIELTSGSHSPHLIDADDIFSHAKSPGPPFGLTFPDYLEALRLLSLPMFPAHDPNGAYCELLQVGVVHTLLLFNCESHPS